jgi:hypothetical protein
MGMGSLAIFFAALPPGNMLEKHGAPEEADLPSPPLLACPRFRAPLQHFLNGCKTCLPCFLKKALHGSTAWCRTLRKKGQDAQNNYQGLPYSYQIEHCNKNLFIKKGDILIFMAKMKARCSFFHLLLINYYFLFLTIYLDPCHFISTRL